MEVSHALFNSEPRLCQISINMLLKLLRLYIECLCVEMGDALYQCNVLLRQLISICSKGDSRACKSEIGLHHFFDVPICSNSMSGHTVWLRKYVFRYSSG